ncbi:MAG TPA: hypothetical protein DDW72_07605, partial [Afipia sp.]|nr:hypothetical protein [Afipia sp.]
IPADERPPRRDRDIGDVNCRNRRVVQALLQFVGRSADIDVGAIESRNKQFLSGGDERLPCVEDARHFAGAHPVQGIVW